MEMTQRAVLLVMHTLVTVSSISEKSLLGHHHLYVWNRQEDPQGSLASSLVLGSVRVLI